MGNNIHYCDLIDLKEKKTNIEREQIERLGQIVGCTSPRSVSRSVPRAESKAEPITAPTNASKPKVCIKNKLLNDVQAFHLSCKCDAFKESENYIGVVIYYIDGKSEFEVNGNRIKSGYVYIKNTKEIENKYPEYTTMHAKTMYSLIGNKYNSLDIDASGFAYQNGTWKSTSRTFNYAYVQKMKENLGDDYHICFDKDDMKRICDYEQKILSVLIKDYYMKNGYPTNLKREPFESYANVTVIFTND